MTQAQHPIEAPGKPAMPRHIAIIMDGNGRWAKARALPRSAGHWQGVEAVRRTVRAAAALGIDYLTLYSFSSENWTRPAREVDYLLNLLRRFIHTDVDELHTNGVRIRIIGDREDLQPDLRELIEDSERLTQANERLNLVVAFNYGSRDEIARAARRMVRDIEAGKLSADDVCADALSGYLDTQGIPDPDLVIRTSGEQRLSNFLLWQCAYAELVFVDEYWPEFNQEIFERAIHQYLHRDRRYGGVTAKVGA
jgi:undecaprenyl diphosphate synthase